jgi:hypothetical protein
MISEAGSGTTLIMAVAEVGSAKTVPLGYVEKLDGGNADAVIWVVPFFSPVNVNVPKSTGRVPMPSSEVSARLACVDVTLVAELSNNGPPVMLLVDRTAAIPEGLLNNTSIAAVASGVLGLTGPPAVCDKKTWTWTVCPSLAV